MMYIVIVVTFLMTIIMNKFTSTNMDDWNLDETHANCWYNA